jgi:hypothetical protein
MHTEPMIVALDSEVHIAYRQLYVNGADAVWSMPDSFAGQANGLCGAAVAGELFLMTGIHTGFVPFVVEIHEHLPEVADEWQDIVEVSFRPASTVVSLTEWAGEDWYPLPLEIIDYRVRYCAYGMDEAKEKDSRFDDEPELDRYLLQFWPAPPAPDRVVRQDSSFAEYLHRVTRGQTMNE